MLLSLCPTYWQIMLVKGVLMGILAGLLDIPIITVITHWFDKKRTTVLGLVMSGSSIGGVVVPIATSKMLNNKHVSRVRVDAEDHRLLHATAARIRERDRQIADPAARHQLLVLGGFQEPEVPDPSRRVVFHAPGPEHPDFFIPTYAAIRGTKATLAGSLFAILNAVSTFGCIIPGVVILFMDMVATDAVLIVYSVVFGFWSGTIMPGAPAALSVCSDDLQKMGPYLGMALFIMSFGNLIGPPINGVLVERYRGFFQAALLSGSITVFGGLVAIFAKFHTAGGVFGRT